MIVGILGSSGFLGTNVVEYLKKIKVDFVEGSRSFNDNLYVDATNYESVKRWISNNEITHVVNLAARCGGIGLNKKHPYKLWSATTRITANTIDACLAENVKRLVMIGTVCSYAASCPTPFNEDNLMNFGMPEPTNRAYGVSKLNGLIGAQAAYEEFGMEVFNLVPVNMYGPHDNFDLETSHVIPAIISKISSAMSCGEKNVSLWGNGEPSREFLFAEDCARAILNALTVDKVFIDPINIGTGVEIKISDLFEMIKEIMGYDGGVVWNDNGLNGQMNRCLDIKRSFDILGWKPEVDLNDGIRKTLEWINKGNK